MKKIVKRIFAAVLCLVAFVVSFVIISNICMLSFEKKRIADDEAMKELNADCIMVLGAGVRNNSPSPMLRDRLDEGIRLYNAGLAKKILVSGDHGSQYYDEVNVMKKYLMEAGIADEDIFMDHAGFSTYESMYRAKEIFGVKRMIVVTQKYHLYRSLYIAKKLGIDVYGSPAREVTYSGALYREIREIAARDKAIFSCLFKVKPQYLGEKIDISGSGAVTND